MADNLKIFGIDYTGVLGVKVTDENDNVVTFVAGGGGYTANDWLDPSKPSGELASDIVFSGDIGKYLLDGRTGITKVSLPNATYIPYGFFQLSGLEELVAPNATSLESYAINQCHNLEYVVLPKLNTIKVGGLAYNNSLKGIDLDGITSSSSNFASSAIASNPLLDTIILRGSLVYKMSNTNVLSSTPFASGGTGGTLYVPNSLKSSYQSASNWSTILGQTNNSIESIEGSYYATHYVDGSLIPT